MKFMTRKNAAYRLWEEHMDQIGTQLSEWGTLYLDDLKIAWVLCFSNNDRNRWWRNMVRDVLGLVEAAYENKVLNRHCSEQAEVYELMAEITAFAAKHDVKTD